MYLMDFDHSSVFRIFWFRVVYAASAIKILFLVLTIHEKYNWTCIFIPYGLEEDRLRATGHIYEIWDRKQVFIA